MTNLHLRQQIASEAARLIYQRRENQYFRARLKASRRIAGQVLGARELPTNREIRDEIRLLALAEQGERQRQHLRDMRFQALRMMRLLRAFKPRLTGGVLTGICSSQQEVDLHVFSGSVQAVADMLDREDLQYDVQAGGQLRVRDRYDFELTIFPEHVAPLASEHLNGPSQEQLASIAQLEELIEREYPQLPVEQVVASVESHGDRFMAFQILLLPLEQVKQPRKYHPEGDVLYHSLQVFQLAREELPYDEEFLLAALLHDVGKGLDPHDHVAAGLEALEPYITPRTAWLIEHHPEAQAILDGTLGHRSRRRLESAEHFEELMLLARCDRNGRQRGVPVLEVEDALDCIRELEAMCGD